MAMAELGLVLRCAAGLSAMFIVCLGIQAAYGQSPPPLAHTRGRISH